MKVIILLMVTISIYANIEITQNIRALYRGVALTENQKDYLEDTRDINIKKFKIKLINEIQNLNIKHIQDKNVVSFILTPAGEIKNIKFLEKSNNHKIDKLTKKAIKENYKKFLTPEKETEIRFIVHFDIGKVQQVYKNNTYEKRKPYYQTIYSATTRFKYSSKEYVRVFETSEDGFVNLTIKPYACAEVRLLTNKNQKIYTSPLPYSFNKEVPKGKYKLLIKVKKTCDVSLQYL